MAWQEVKLKLAEVADGVERDMSEMSRTVGVWISDLGEVERLVLLCLALLGLFYFLMRRSNTGEDKDPMAGYFAAAVLVLVVFGVAAGRIITGEMSLPGMS